MIFITKYHLQKKTVATIDVIAFDVFWFIYCYVAFIVSNKDFLEFINAN